MGKREDQGSQIRPLHEPPPEPETTRRSVIGVVALAVVAFGAIVVSTGSDPSPTAGTVPPPIQPVITSTLPIEPPATSVPLNALAMIEAATEAALVAHGLAIWDLLPEATGVFVATTGGTSGTDLVWSTRDRVEVFTDTPAFFETMAFDASGQQFARIGDSPGTYGAGLHLGTKPSDPIIDNARSFAWHATVPGRIAWVVPGVDELCWADVKEAGGLTPATCVPGRDGQLFGFDDDGFLLNDHVGRTIWLLDLAGRVLASVTGDDALMGPDGRILIVSRDFLRQETVFTVTDRNLTNPERLDWAPPNATGAPVIAAWSPLLSEQRLAFLVWEDDAFHLQVWSTDGEFIDSVDLDGRVWGIDWDSTGRYILVPGEVNFAVADPTAYVVYAYDTFTFSLVTLSFDGWVQQALLVTPSVCETASHVAAAFSSSLPTGVELGTAQMVKSRDANLESWYFMSATINTGRDAGAIATWAMPGFAGGIDSVNTPNLAVPINDAATQLEFGLISLDPTNYLVSDWIQLDGAHASQDCVIKAEQ